MSNDRACSPDPVPPARDPGQVDLAAPSAAQARAAVTAAAGGTRLTALEVDGLVLGVSEVVANAHQHGAPPVRVVITAWHDRVEVRVSDAGPGPDHLDVAAAGGDLSPVPAAATHGRGLWLAHRSCAEVEVVSGEAGCTVRLGAGRAPR